MVFDIEFFFVFCEFGKMIICEFVFKGCVFCICVYNFILNLICLVVNLIREMYNISRVCFVCVLNIIMVVIDLILLNFEFFLMFFNDIWVELIEIVVFVIKYYGIDDVVKGWMCRSFDFIRNVIMDFVNRYGYYFRGKV